MKSRSFPTEYSCYSDVDADAAAGTGAPEVALAYRLRVLFETKITARYRNSFRGELGRTQAEVLEYLYENGSSRAQNIAEAIHIPKQHVSKIVTQFIADGLVVSNPSESDKRAKQLTLTQKGKQLINEHLAISNQAFLEQLDTLTSEERQDLAQSMKVIVSLLEKI